MCHYSRRGQRSVACKWEISWKISFCFDAIDWKKTLARKDRSVLSRADIVHCICVFMYKVDGTATQRDAIVIIILRGYLTTGIEKLPVAWPTTKSDELTCGLSVRCAALRALAVSAWCSFLWMKQRGWMRRTISERIGADITTLVSWSHLDVRQSQYSLFEEICAIMEKKILKYLSVSRTKTSLLNGKVRFAKQSNDGNTTAGGFH